MASTLQYRDKIAVLTLGDDENRFSPDWLDALDAQLTDATENAQRPHHDGTSGQVLLQRPRPRPG